MKAAEEYRKPMQIQQMKILGGYGHYICPQCGMTLDREFMAYCDRCGQCLDWKGYRKAAVVNNESRGAVRSTFNRKYQSMSVQEALALFYENKL